VNTDKMRRQLARGTAELCPQRGCSRPVSRHYHYLAGPDVPEEIVYFGSVRAAEITAHDRLRSGFRGIGRQFGHALNFGPKPGLRTEASSADAAGPTFAVTVGSWRRVVGTAHPRGTAPTDRSRIGDCGCRTAGGAATGLRIGGQSYGEASEE
jgi:hypothetical protein